MKRLLKRHWPLICIFLLLIVLAVYLFDSDKGDEPPPTNTAGPGGMSTEVKNLQLTQDDPARGLRWTLNAESAQVSPDQQVYRFKEFRIKMESKNRPAMTLTGREGNLDRKSEVLKLQGEITAESENQYRFQTEQLTYDVKRDTLTADKRVRLEGPFFAVEGSGLLIDVQKQNCKIKKHSNTVITGKLVI